MKEIKSEQWIIADLDSILSWIDAFILDRKARNSIRGTIHFYRNKLEKFWRCCQLRGINQIPKDPPLESDNAECIKAIFELLE